MMHIFTISASEKEEFEAWKKEHDAKIRADAIENYKKKIEFVYKWLFDCKVLDSKNVESDIEIAFDTLIRYAEHLKREQK